METVSKSKVRNVIGVVLIVLAAVVGLVAWSWVEASAPAGIPGMVVAAALALGGAFLMSSKR